MPIIQIVIMKKCASNELFECDLGAEALMMTIAEIGNPDGMVKGVAFYMMSMLFHGFVFVGTYDLLDQMMKFGVFLHVITYFLRFMIVVCDILRFLCK